MVGRLLWKGSEFAGIFWLKKSKKNYTFSQVSIIPVVIVNGRAFKPVIFYSVYFYFYRTTKVFTEKLPLILIKYYLFHKKFSADAEIVLNERNYFADETAYLRF